MSNRPVVRFAPSPTGRIHIGNARTALLNWLIAMRQRGQFILRFDDTDRERSRAEFAGSIETDLAWLGVAPDLQWRQSDRMALYDAAAGRALFHPLRLALTGRESGPELAALLPLIGSIKALDRLSARAV